MEYFVVMQDYGRRGREAIVDPEQTRRDVVACLRSGEFKNIAFIHRIRDGVCEDVTNEVLKETGFYDDDPPEIDRQAARFDYQQDLRKHGEPV